jgi:hypothetical protein
MVDATSAHSSPQSDRITYVVRLPDGTEFGPLPAAEVRSLVKQGAIPSGAFLRRADGKHWRLISELIRPEEFRTDRDSQPSSQAEPGQHAAGVVAPSMRPSPVSPEVYRAGPTAQASSPSSAPRPARSPSQSYDVSKLVDVLGPIVAIAVGVTLVGGVFWLTNQTGLKPGLIIVILKFLAFAIPAGAGGLWALAKASERSR